MNGHKGKTFRENLMNTYSRCSCVFIEICDDASFAIVMYVVHSGVLWEDEPAYPETLSFEEFSLPVYVLAGNIELCSHYIRTKDGCIFKDTGTISFISQIDGMNGIVTCAHVVDLYRENCKASDSSWTLTADCVTALELDVSTWHVSYELPCKTCEIDAVFIPVIPNIEVKYFPWIEDQDWFELFCMWYRNLNTTNSCDFKTHERVEMLGKIKKNLETKVCERGQFVVLGSTKKQPIVLQTVLAKSSIRPVITCFDSTNTPPSISEQLTFVKSTMDTEFSLLSSTLPEKGDSGCSVWQITTDRPWKCIGIFTGMLRSGNVNFYFASPIDTVCNTIRCEAPADYVFHPMADDDDD